MMAREVWIKADVYGLETLKDGTLKPVARCGHYETGPEIVWAVLDAASRLHDLECWAKGIVNSSNNLLVHICPDGYAPLGKADGPAKPVFGMQIREARNDFSRDKPIEFLPSKECAERMCRLRQKFCGLEDDLSCILITNGIKPDLLTLKQLVFLANMIDATLKKEYKSPVTLDSSVLEAIKKI